MLPESAGGLPQSLVQLGEELRPGLQVGGPRLDVLPNQVVFGEWIVARNLQGFLDRVGLDDVHPAGPVQEASGHDDLALVLESFHVPRVVDQCLEGVFRCRDQIRTNHPIHDRVFHEYLSRVQELALLIEAAISSLLSGSSAGQAFFLVIDMKIAMLAWVRQEIYIDRYEK